MTCAQGLLRLLWGGARSWSATGLGTSYRGPGSLEAVSTLCDEKVDHETFLESALLLAKYDNI